MKDVNPHHHLSHILEMEYGARKIHLLIWWPKKEEGKSCKVHVTSKSWAAAVSCLGVRGLAIPEKIYLSLLGTIHVLLAPLAQMVDNAIHWINLYPVLLQYILWSLFHWIEIYPMDSIIYLLNNQGLMFNSIIVICRLNNMTLKSTQHWDCWKFSWSEV